MSLTLNLSHNLTVIDFGKLIAFPLKVTLILLHLVYCFLHATGCRVKLEAKTETEHRWI